MNRLKQYVIILFIPLLSISQPVINSGSASPYTGHMEDDSVIWASVNAFCHDMSSRDSLSMKQLLPDDFILQWMHENFITKTGILNAMQDSATISCLAFRARRDNGSMFRFSDDLSAASISTSFDFVNPDQMKSIEKGHGYGLCIFYFKKENGAWMIKTVHVDLHCSLCNF